MSSIRRALVAGTGLLFLMSMGANADVLLGFQQIATGNLSSFTDPPTTGEAVSFNQFSQANANSAVQGMCPANFTCSNAFLYEIDLSLTANATQSVTLSNSGSSANLGCLSTVNGNSSPCSGASTSLSTGVGVAGTLQFQGIDPNNNTVFLKSGDPFTVATNTYSSGLYSYVLSPGSTPFSGSSNLNLGPEDAYDSTHDGNWGSDEAPYVGGGQVTINFNLTAGYSDQTNPSGVTSTLNTAVVNSGTVTATYFYGFTDQANGATPEPATLFLMGTALVGVGLLRKRMKA